MVSTKYAVYGGVEKDGIRQIKAIEEWQIFISKNMNRILDGKGKLIGFTKQTGNIKTTFDNKGSVVAREYAGRTFDNKGSFSGFGSQGLRILGEKKR